MVWDGGMGEKHFLKHYFQVLKMLWQQRTMAPCRWCRGCSRSEGLIQLLWGVDVEAVDFVQYES